MLFYNSEQLFVGFEYYEEFVPLPQVFRIGKATVSASSSGPSLEDSLCVLLDVAKGVAFMHSRRFFHRDLSPNNILLRQSDWSVKILDFGESTWQQKEERSAAHRSTGQPDIGTAVYKAPERWRGDELTAASDVFSFGIMAWEILTRQQAWQKPEHREKPLDDDKVGRAILSGERPPVALLEVCNVPKSLPDLLEKCWKHEVEERSSMPEVMVALRNIQNGLLHGVDGFERRYGSSRVYRVLHHYDITQLVQGNAIRAQNAQ
jgi:serine/threonine protein kinase